MSKKTYMGIYYLGVYGCPQMSVFTHPPNLKHSHPSEILVYYLTYTPTQSWRHKWMTLKSNIFDSEKNS